MIDSGALVLRNHKPSVAVVRDGRVHFVPVRRGWMTGRRSRSSRGSARAHAWSSRHRRSSRRTTSCSPSNGNARPRRTAAPRSRGATKDAPPDTDDAVGHGIAVAICVAWAGPARADAPTPLTLKEAIQIARAHHPTIEAAGGEATATYGRKEQALARLLPFVQAGVTYQPTTPNLVVTPAQSRAIFASAGTATVIDAYGSPVVVSCRTPGVGDCESVTAPPNVWTMQSFWLLNVGLSWTAWDWGRSIYGYRSARDLAAAADAGLRVATQDVALQVALAFYVVIAAAEQVAVTEDAVKTYGAHLAQTRALHDQGLRTGIDVATAESAEAQVAIALARARAAQSAARAQFQVALGVDRWRDWQLVPEPSAFELQAGDDRNADAPAGTLVDAAESRRPEVAQYQLQVSGQASAVSATRGSYLPQLTLSIGPSWAGRELGR